MVNASKPGGGFPQGEPEIGATWVEGVDGFAEGERLRLAVESRRRDRWRRDRVVDSVTTASTLRAAVGSAVTLHLTTGAQVHGQVFEVGSDVVGIGEPAVRWIATAAIEAVGIAGAPASEPEGVERTMADILEDLRSGDPIAVQVAGGATFVGEVVGNGDAVTLRDGRTGTHVVIDPSAIVMVLA